MRRLGFIPSHPDLIPNHILQLPVSPRTKRHQKKKKAFSKTAQNHSVQYYDLEANKIQLNALQAY